MAHIDVLLPVKNGISFFAEALDSICNQTFKDWRLLILDHGSNDGSLELAQQYQARDPRIEVHSFPHAVGLAGLLNMGLDICDCTYVMRHDADDIAFPDRMEVTLAAFKAQPDTILIGGQAIEIDSAGTIKGEISMPIGAKRFLAASFFRSPFIHPAIAMDFSAIKKMGVRYGIDFIKVLPPEKSILVEGLAEDYIMFGQMALLGNCTNIEVPLIKYRWHESNVSKTRFNDQVKTCLDISRFLVRSFCTLKKQPYFDPAPFCNHGGILLDVDGKTDFSKEFEVMASTLRQALGQSEELERELAYRKVISTRNELMLLWRYYWYQNKYTPEVGEWYAIRAWLVRRFPGKKNMRVASIPS